MLKRTLFRLLLGALGLLAPAGAEPASPPASPAPAANSLPRTIAGWHKVTDTVWALYGIQITVPARYTAMSQNNNVPLLGVRLDDDRFHAAFMILTRVGAESALAQAHAHAAEESAKPTPLVWKPGQPGLVFQGESYSLGGPKGRVKGYGYLSDRQKYLVFFFEVREPAASFNTATVFLPLLQSARFGRPL